MINIISNVFQLLPTSDRNLLTIENYYVLDHETKPYCDFETTRSKPLSILKLQVAFYSYHNNTRRYFSNFLKWLFIMDISRVNPPQPDRLVLMGPCVRLGIIYFTVLSTMHIKDIWISQLTLWSGKISCVFKLFARTI